MVMKREGRQSGEGEGVKTLPRRSDGEQRKHSPGMHAALLRTLPDAGEERGARRSMQVVSRLCVVLPVTGPKS